MNKSNTVNFLRKNWNELNYNEKQYFKNNEIWFLSKKQDFIKTSEITNLIKSYHAKLKLVKTNAERQEVASELIKLDDQRADLYLKIDNFNEPV